MKPAIRVREWGRIGIGPDGLDAAEAEGFARTAAQAARALKLPETAVLAPVHGGLKAGQVCGVLHRRSRTLEITPKIENGRAALAAMLATVHDLPLHFAPEAEMDHDASDLLEVLIGAYARGLLAELRRGAHRMYRPEEEDLPHLRGGLDLRRQFTTLLAQPQRLACRYEELSPDTPLNRLLKAAARLAFGVSRREAHRRALRDALDRLEAVADVAAPAAAIRFDRATARFRGLAGFARMMLSARRQGAQAGEDVGIALLFPMNDLFEAYVARRLRQVLGPCVRAQVSGRHALYDATGGVFALRPDVVVDLEEGPLILDTKWKDPAASASRTKSDPRRRGVQQADVYQILAYGDAWSRRGGLGQAEAAPRLMLLYPHHAGLGAEGVFGEWTSGGGLRFQAASFALPPRTSQDEAAALRSLMV